MKFINALIQTVDFVFAGILAPVVGLCWVVCYCVLFLGYQINNGFERFMDLIDGEEYTGPMYTFKEWMKDF